MHDHANLQPAHYAVCAAKHGTRQAQQAADETGFI